MIKRSLILLFCGCLLFACGNEKTTEVVEKLKSVTPKKPYRWVDDIKNDPEIDDPSFELCYSDFTVKQYFNIGDETSYEGERPAIYRFFEENYAPVETDQSGFIRVRFIVNCKGETGRFRVISSDENFEEMEFDPAIVDQLVSITKSMDGWKILPDPDIPTDYYQYLIFKIEKGKILEILP